MNNNALIELIVNNHSGVMSHITGLFSRRGYNLEGILCGKVGDGSLSQMFLLVDKTESSEQILKQLQKLYDVKKVNYHTRFNHTIFEKLDKLIEAN